MSNEKHDALALPNQPPQQAEIVRSSARQTRLAAFTPANLTEAIALAKMMASSEIVPKDYQRKPANIIVAIQFGAEIGLPPMQSLQSVSVINGRPALWGDGALALVQGHPDFEDIQETISPDQKSATCLVKRRGRSPVQRTFTLEDAAKANLLGKGPWTQYRNRMLQMRARGFALRDSFADVLKGISIAEEAMDIPTDTSQAKQTREAMTFDVTNLQASEQSNRGHEDTGLDKKPNGKTIEAQPEAKEAPAMCGNCGKIGSHTADCKYAAKSEQDRLTSQEMSASMYLVEAAESKVSKKQGTYVVLSVMAQDGLKGKLYIWDTKIHTPFLTQDYSNPVPAIMEVSEREKDGKKFVQVEHLIELGSQKFVNDQPAESGMAEEVGEALFGKEDF